MAAPDPTTVLFQGRPVLHATVTGLVLLAGIAYVARAVVAGRGDPASPIFLLAIGSAVLGFAASVVHLRRRAAGRGPTELVDFVGTVLSGGLVVTCAILAVAWLVLDLVFGP